MKDKIIVPSGVQFYFRATSIYKQRLFYVEFDPKRSSDFESWCFYNNLNDHPLITKGPNFVFTKPENANLFDYEN